ncbi:hypothetical protein [Nocardioides mesophilus]|uniref:Uncharacterized protein n=1 Tax=Nocardioides mesophilus TaxID=433659 RepID=A0A7G9RC18_9ACTN|nr:hypothetical protein [Nocardioides mesophilus]QNN53143.1 hypothetical protein H9L09_01180 [Nocardioides mesophilus]
MQGVLGRMILRTVWPPAALLAAATSALLLMSGLAATDLLRFSTYAVLALVLPGTLLWRLARPCSSRLWLEDIVFGAILGYAMEIVCYIPARAVGAPLLVLAWPAATYLVCLVTRAGRACWRPEGATRLPPSWSWSIAAVMTYLILFVARANWWEAGLDVNGLRMIGPDATFQLALTGELRHHMPAAIPWVTGEPLHYHWLTYVHTASASWISGVEPIVLLRRLSPLLMVVLTVLATALIAAKLTGRLAIGPLAAGLLVLVHSPAFAAAEADLFQRQEFTSQAIFGSPTMTFGALLFCGVLFLLVEVLDGRSTWSSWPLLVLFLGAASGAKATFAPLMVAGVLTVLMVGLLTRTVRRAHVGLLLVAVSSWLAFQFGFYGGEGTGVRLDATGTLDFAAASIGAITPAPLSVAGLLLAGLIVTLWSVHMAGMIGLLVRGGWRVPFTAFAFGITAAAIGASLLLDLGLFSQQWFVCSTQVVVAIAAAAGFSRLLPEGSPRELRSVAILGVVLAAAGMAVSWASSITSVPPLGPTLSRTWDYADGFLMVLAVIVVAGVAVSRLPVAGSRGITTLVFLCAALTGLGVYRTAQLSLSLAAAPWARPSMTRAADTTVGVGGVEAARWVRAHTSPDDVLATNAHTLTPASKLIAVFWLAGYAERRVFIEGWGYTPHHARLMAETGAEFDDVPFWDAAALTANDKAFTDPSRGDLDRLREYGVSWLVLDRRFPADEQALTTLVEPSFENGDYAVYSLRG